MVNGLPENCREQLREICGNCGCTYGAHCASEYYNEMHKKLIPCNCCPGHEGIMDWDEGPGTTFESTGIYKEDKEEK